MVLPRHVSGAFPLSFKPFRKGATAPSANKRRFGLSVWPRVCTGPLMLLNELMMPQEMDFKDASAGSRITCACVRRPISLTQLGTAGSPRTCWHQLVLWNSLPSRAVKSLVWDAALLGKEAPRGVRGDVSCPELIELSGFRGYQSPLISCHIFVCVCFDIRLWHKHFA